MINTPQREGLVVCLEIAAGKKIEEGMIVALNSTGLLVPATDEEAKTVVGRANGDAYNLDGEDGEETVSVQRKTAFLFANSTGADEVKRTHLFKNGYLGEDAVIACKAGTPARIAVGTIIEVSQEGVWVEIS